MGLGLYLGIIALRARFRVLDGFRLLGLGIMARRIRFKGLDVFRLLGFRDSSS